MEFVKKVNAWILGLAVLLAFGCGEENKQEDPAPENFTHCKIASFKNDADSVGYTYVYNAQGKLVQANKGRAQKEFFEYNSLGKVSKLKIWRSGEDTIEVFNYEYNSDSLLIKLTKLRRSGPGSVYTPIMIRSFSYDQQKRQVNSSYHDVSQPSVIREKMNFTYLSNNSVKQETFRYNFFQNAWEVTMVADITFDNQKTPWNKKEDHYSIVTYVDPLLNGNETSWKATFYNQGPPPYTHTVISTYTYNSAGYPIEKVSALDGGAPSITKYTYNCQ